MLPIKCKLSMLRIGYVPVLSFFNTMYIKYDTFILAESVLKSNWMLDQSNIDIRIEDKEEEEFAGTDQPIPSVNLNSNKFKRKALALIAGVAILLVLFNYWRVFVFGIEGLCIFKPLATIDLNDGTKI